MNWKDKEDLKKPQDSKDNSVESQSCAMKVSKACMESDKDTSEENIKSDKFLCDSDEDMSDFSSEDENSGNDGGETKLGMLN